MPEVALALAYSALSSVTVYVFAVQPAVRVPLPSPNLNEPPVFGSLFAVYVPVPPFVQPVNV